MQPINLTKIILKRTSKKNGSLNSPLKQTVKLLQTLPLIFMLAFTKTTLLNLKDKGFVLQFSGFMDE